MKKPERAGASPVEEVGTSPIRSGYLPILAPYPKDWNANLQKIFHQNKASGSFLNICVKIPSRTGTTMLFPAIL